jgi:hypothetical protein
MSVLPLKPWVNKTRKLILWVGFGWPIAGFIITREGPGIWAAIGITFLATIFVPPAFVVSLLLPTYKWRIIVVPPALIAVYWWISSQSYTYNGFSIHPYMLLWITTFTAIGLMLPQYSTVEFFFRRLFETD